LPATPPAAFAAVSLDAFFRGAGLPAQRLDDKQTEQVLHRLGQLMREVVLGVTENLHLRAEQKNVMHVPTTTIQPQNNNPLKFSASVEEALNNLLFRDSAEYLSAVDAVRETFGDIKQHQQNILGALRSAVVDYVGRLDPDELESKVSNGRSGPLINAANKLKYWDLFKDLYQVVSAHQPGQFPHQFLEELARAYEREESRSAPAGGAARQAKRG
jgi:type VI secretion system FHA domain protein